MKYQKQLITVNEQDYSGYLITSEIMVHRPYFRDHKKVWRQRKTGLFQVSHIPSHKGFTRGLSLKDAICVAEQIPALLFLLGLPIDQDLTDPIRSKHLDDINNTIQEFIRRNNNQESTCENR